MTEASQVLYLLPNYIDLLMMKKLMKPMIMMTNDDSYTSGRACHVPGIFLVFHLIFKTTKWISDIIILILQMKNPKLREVRLLKVTCLVRVRDRNQIQVCLTSKTMYFVKPNYATPQSWVSFGLTQRTESHILIPEIQPGQDRRQRSFHLLLPSQGQFSGISLPPEDTQVSVTPLKCLWVGNTLILSQVYLDH